VSRTLPIRPDLADVQAYRWQEGVPTDIPLARFDMNTRPTAPAWYAAAQARFARLPVQIYPDATYDRLRAALGEYAGFPAERVIPVTGADEALVICALAALRPGDRAFARRPRYPVYESAARLAGAELADEPDGARLRFVCAPHNPTGADPAPEELEEGDGLLVIDQAYVEYGGPDLAPLALERDATVVVRTLSKAFGLAGARVGYLLVPEALVDPFDAIRLPAGISTMAVAMAELALENVDEMRAAVAEIVGERERMTAALRAAGFTVRDSSANFFLVDTGRPALEVFAELAAQGLVVRTFGDPLLAQSIRISPALPDDNDRLLAALGAAPPPRPPAEAGRAALVDRRTRETEVRCRLAIDGSGTARVTTGIGFLDHMLTALACHALFDLELTCQGDLWVDAHHTVEDVAIALGEGLDRALGDRAGVRRFGDARAPLDEALAHATVDLSGRGIATCDLRLVGPAIGELPAPLVPHFFDSLARNARLGLHLRGSGRDDHHLVEAAFKALALALRAACEPDTRRGGAVPSTKGGL
jgi:imidazoleglycerol phosphate dehydratase HisB/histidinol-phosphate/aromatic aminotransferase/cobyric acid decarboxylase-like protein